MRWVRVIAVAEVLVLGGGCSSAVVGPVAPGLAGSVTGSSVHFSNVSPRRDAAGAIIDAHDGNYLLDPDRSKWWYFGMG